MAADSDNEERVLESQLDLQLREQRDSLAALDQALASEPTNSEILAVRDELVEAIKDAEEGLFHLKRARLLKEADIALESSGYGVKVVNQEHLDVKDVEEEPVDEYSVGSKCRFRFSDGRWYNGLIVGLEGSNDAKVSFLTPTSEKMLMCKFFLQQRCRFGSNCRLSHGIDLPVSSLKKYNPSMWGQSLVGSSIWATSDSNGGIWREAELESWDDKLRLGHVVFRDDGSSLKLHSEFISLSEYAQMSDEEESESSSEQSDSTDYEEDSHEGLSYLGSSTLQRGIQTETAIFAKWENHTRGVASKIMANMGYCEGMGLGVAGQGMVNPISVKVLPRNQSLDHALDSLENEENKEKVGRKRSRGGKRKHDKKYAAAARAAKQDLQESSTDMFSLINKHLAMQGDVVKNSSDKKQQNKYLKEGEKEDRHALLAYDDEVVALRARIGKLEEMVKRNKKEKVVYEAALQKLNETRKALAEVEAAYASTSNAVLSKEKEKRWLKF